MSTNESFTGNELIQKLTEKFSLSAGRVEQIRKVIEVFPAKVSQFYFNLIKEIDDPVWKLCIPDIREIDDYTGEADPLAEERDSPCSLVTHRYPDRILFLISNQCEVYCRYCTRKRKIGTKKLVIDTQKIRDALDYVKANKSIRDVLLSGGDALCVPLERLEFILSELRRIPHVEIIRIGTRLPCTNPSKITPELCEMLKKFHPLYVNINIEHPRELTPDLFRACELLANAGIPLGNQNVLLKGVNDDVATLKELYTKLLRMRVKPYYLYQADYVTGTNHFRTRVEKGMEIIQALQGNISGLAIPHYVIDAPNGGGKIPILPRYILRIDEREVVMKNYQGNVFTYPQKRDIT